MGCSVARRMKRKKAKADMKRRLRDVEFMNVMISLPFRRRLKWAWIIIRGRK